MKIRYAVPTDADVITQFNILLAEESEHLHLENQTVHAGVASLLSDRQKGFYIVAENHDTIIGQLMITYEWSDWRNTMIWWIQSVYVTPAWRKKGVFSRLLGFIAEEARKQHVQCLRLYVYQENTQAIQVYRKSGMIQAPYLVFELKHCARAH